MTECTKRVYVRISLDCNVRRGTSRSMPPRVREGGAGRVHDEVLRSTVRLLCRSCCSVLCLVVVCRRLRVSCLFGLLSCLLVARSDCIASVRGYMRHFRSCCQARAYILSCGGCNKCGRIQCELTYVSLSLSLYIYIYICIYITYIYIYMFGMQMLSICTNVLNVHIYGYSAYYRVPQCSHSYRYGHVTHRCVRCSSSRQHHQHQLLFNLLCKFSVSP